MPHQSTDEPGTLVKFGRREHLQLMFDEGVIYMNNLPYFWAIKDTAVRGDVNDGVDSLYRGEYGEMLDNKSKELITTFHSWDWRSHTDAELTNIFCMYSLRASTSPIDERCIEFGDSAIVFNNPIEFSKRLGAEVIKKGLIAESDLVKYLPDDHIGEVGHFRKLEKFSWQAE